MPDKIPGPIGGATDCAELAAQSGLITIQAAKLPNRMERELEAAGEGGASWK